MAEQNNDEDRIRTRIERIEGQLHSIRTVLDDAGNEIHKIITPLMVEFHLSDACQVIVGSCVLAIPLAFTEEVWKLGQELPAVNVSAIWVVSIVFMAIFVYFIFYRGEFRIHKTGFAIRVLIGYTITFLTAVIILTLVDKCPWASDPGTALKRVVLVSFPAVFSGTVVDSLK